MRLTDWMAGLIACAPLLLASAEPCFAANSKLVGTNGATQIEGAAGGGLVPWALIAGLDSEGEVGANAFYTRIEPQDFGLSTFGAAMGIRDRVEISVARQNLDLGGTVPSRSIRMDVIAAKMRLAGDAIFSANSWLPQIAAGAQYKKNRDYDSVPRALGAKQDSGVDLYIAATKVFLAGMAGRTTVINATLRFTQANQLGFLGFGGDRNGYSMQPELSGGVFVTDVLIVGAEYRFKPDNLSVFKENDFADVFIAWFLHKSFCLVGAYTDLGDIAGKSNQRGGYFSLQYSL